MVVQKISLDGLVGTVIPGVIAISLFVPLLPARAFVSNLVADGAPVSGVYVVLLGYIAGRGFREAGNIHPVTRLIRYLDSVFTNIGLHEYLSAMKIDPSNSTFEERMTTIATNPDTRSQRVCLALSSWFHDEPDPKNLFRAEYAEVREFGESLLYGKQNKFKWYEITLVYFRSLFLIFLLLGMLYWLHYVGVALWGYASIWSANTPDWYPHYLTAIVISAFVYPCLHQQIRFQHKRTTAFINDLAIELGERGIVDVDRELSLDGESVDGAVEVER